MISSIFYTDLASFLKTLESPLIQESDRFIFTEKQIMIVPMSVDAKPLCNVMEGIDRMNRTIFLWEDVWVQKNGLVRMRLKGEVCGRKAIFARNCTLRTIKKEEADAFFKETHLLGAARVKFCYGLFFHGQLVAAAAFSGMRNIQRGMLLFRSAEWVRYASLPHLTVTGGMSKLLSAFVKEHQPDDVMSYANKDWSEGVAYAKLGFEAVGETPIQHYWFDPQTMQRYPLKRYLIPQPHWKRVCGLGSLKFIYYL